MAVSEDIDIKQENANVESLEEFVFDQDLVVTYKKLSKLLNVHVNKAKRLLSIFVEKARKGKRPISVTHLVSGKEVTDDTETWRVCVVPEEQLESTKQKFVSEGLSHHVYSVHQGTKVIDTAALISASKSDESQTSIAAIENKNAKPRDQDKMQQLIKKAAAASAASVKPEPKASTSKPNSMSTNKKKPEAPVIKKEPDVKEEIKEEKEEEPVVAKKPATINGMFAAQNSKAADTNGKPAPKATNSKGSKKNNSGGNIASFFQRQNSAPKKPASETPETSASEQNDSQTSTPSQPEPVQVKKEPTPVSDNKAKKTQTNSKSKSKQSSKKRKSKDETEAPKKRKRIMAISDSESSDNDSEVDMMEDDAPPPPVSLVVESDEEEQVKETTETSIAGGSVTIKEKKLVDKVYKDEKGFIVTKKEWVVETRTEEVEVAEVKTVSKTETTEVKPAVAKRKQQTDLMSFFGRKTK